MNSKPFPKPASPLCLLSGPTVKCAACLLLVLTLTGCATQSRQSANATALPGGLAGYGKVGLVMDNYPLAVSFHNLSKGDTARAGFADGVADGVDWMNTAAEGTLPLFCVGYVYGLIPYVSIRAASSAVGALGGVAGGAISGVSQPQVQRAEKAFGQARVARTLQEGVEQHLLAGLGEPPGGAVASTRVLQKAHSDRAGLFATMQHEGFDTALEVTVLGAALRASTPANTQLSLRVPVYVRLVRLRDGRQLHSFTVEYLSPRTAARSLETWGADDARLLQAQLARCSTDLASQIAARLLPAAPPAAVVPLVTTRE